MVYCESYQRAQIYELEYRYLIQFLNWWKSPTEKLTVPMFIGLPFDARVVSVYVNYERSCLDILIESKTFPEVFQGDAFPRVRAGWVPFEVAKIVPALSETANG